MNPTYKAYFTNDTMRGIMLEASRHPGNECIVQMPGVRKGNNFYYDLVADSGINATYTYGMCEKDHKYVDHLTNRLLVYHDFDVQSITVSQIHKHPHGYNRFSGGDKIPNTKLARQFGGVMNGLFWVDPEFKLKMFYIDTNGCEYEAEWEVNDEAVAENFPKKNLEMLKKTVEEKEKPFLPKIHEEKDKKKSVRPAFFDRFTKKNKDKAIDKNTEEENNSMADMNTNNICEDRDVGSAFDFSEFAFSNRPYNVLIPDSYREEKYEGELYGYYTESSKTFNIVTDKVKTIRNDTILLGYAGQYSIDSDVNYRLEIKWTEDGQDIVIDGNSEVDIEVEYYSTYKDVFSRNKGVIESEMMADKQAVIAGLTNGGFTVGEKLIEAGIGNLVVCDGGIVTKNDVGNGFEEDDVGKFRVEAFRQHAVAINPECKVVVFKEAIGDIKFETIRRVIGEKTVILSCTDNRALASVCRDYADILNIPFVAAGFDKGSDDGRLYLYNPEGKSAAVVSGYRDVKSTGIGTIREVASGSEEVYKALTSHIETEFSAFDVAKAAMDCLMKDEDGYCPKFISFLDSFTASVGDSMEMFKDEGCIKDAGRSAGYKVYIPETYRQNSYEGDLYGFYIEETGTFNIVPEVVSEICPQVIRLGFATGEADEAAVDSEVSKLCIVWDEGSARAVIAGGEDRPVDIEFYASYGDRNDVKFLKNKRAFIAGVGSGGYVVAMALVKAGIPSICVCDDDLVQYDNVGKHPCKSDDVGKYKVDAFKIHAALINPDCEVYAFRDLFQDVNPNIIEELITPDSVLLCCTDNRHAAYKCNEFSNEYHIPFVAGGCGSRASSGELFVYKPDMDMPCYTCGFGEDRGVDFANNRFKREFYTTQKDLERMSKHSGMSIDICFTAYDIVKAGIDLLMEDEEGYESGFLAYHNQFTATINYVVDEDLNQIMKMFNPNIGERRPYARKSSVVIKNEKCSCCGKGTATEEVS